MLPGYQLIWFFDFNDKDNYYINNDLFYIIINKSMFLRIGDDQLLKIQSLHLYNTNHMHNVNNLC